MSWFAIHIDDIRLIAICMQYSEWTTTFSVDAYGQYFRHSDVKQSNDSYMTRVRLTQTDYHSRPFVHAVSHGCENQCSQLPVDASIAGKDSKSIARGWLGRLASSIPKCNRECGVAAAHARAAFGIDVEHDGLRVIFIKVCKVASTSSASIFFRFALSHDNTESLLWTPKSAKRNHNIEMV